MASDVEIMRAAELLRRGQVVGMPTETVYGLAADARSDEAVRRIFQVKGRPGTNPLIVHVSDVANARRCAGAWTELADTLAERFWPGALTMVVRKGREISAVATAGKETVGLRVPAHPVALALLRECGFGLAAPSANKSNHVSPTRAEHVRGDFTQAEVPLVLDGGACEIGIESTVIDVSDPTRQPVILRPGGVSQREIERVIGPVEVYVGHVGHGEAASSPGQQAVHYAPRTPAYRFEPSQRPSLDMRDAAIVDLTLDPQTYARNLYARLRMLDGQGLRAIYVECPPEAAEWAGVRDRVLRGTREWRE